MVDEMRVHLCSFSASGVGEWRGKRLTYDAVKAAVVAAGRFSVWEATATGRHARLFTTLCNDPDLEIDHTQPFPWTGVRAKGA